MHHEKSTALVRTVALALAVGALWVSVVSVLYLTVQPLRLLDGQMVFDPWALLSASSIMVFLAILPWIPAFLFLAKRSGPLPFLLVVACVWAILGTLFYKFQGSPSLSLIGDAERVLADGQDIAFMPLVIPAVSFLSGSAYCVAVGLFERFKRPKIAEHEGAAP